MKAFMVMISFLLFPFILVSAFSSENFENADEKDFGKFRGREFIVNPRIRFMEASKEILNDNNKINSFTNTQSQIETKPFDVYSATLVISPINTQSYWMKNIMSLILDGFLKKISTGKYRKEFEEESYPIFSEMELAKFPDQSDFFDPMHVVKFLHKKQDSIDISKRMPEVLKITPSLKRWKEFLSPRQKFDAGHQNSIPSTLKQNIKRKHRKGKIIKLNDSLKDSELETPVHKQNIQKNRGSDDALLNFFPKEVIYKPLNTQYHEKMISRHPLKTITEHFEEKLSDGKLILKKKHLNLNNNNRNFVSNVPTTDFSKTRLSNLPVETVIRPLNTEPKTKILERDVNIREINNNFDSNGIISHPFIYGLYPNIYGVSYSILGKDFTSKKLQDDSKADDAPGKLISRNDKFEEEKKNFETESSDSMKPF